MREVRIISVPEKRIEEILSATKPLRSLDQIALDIVEIWKKGEKGVNLSDAEKLEEFGLELIRHGRETITASY